MSNLPSTFYEALHSVPFTDPDNGALPFIVGVDPNGRTVIKDFSLLTHLVVAGTTGVGKSTLAHAILLSLIGRTNPKDLGIFLCDTKMVELGMYRNIPHLMFPTVSDPAKVSGVIAWILTETRRRLALFATVGCRSIDTYNEHLLQQSESRLSHVLLVIDDVTEAIQNNDTWNDLRMIAQTGRSVGIHLLLITQKPTERNLAEIINNSIPSRAIFNTLNDNEEKLLLGSAKNTSLSDIGEIIFYAIPSRIKEKIRCYPISDIDISTITSELRKRYVDYVRTDSVALDPIDPAITPDEFEGDYMLPAAVDIILEAGQASVSILQRRLMLGYARAARIVDEMEKKGIVGSFQGSKPRAILITKSQWEFMRNSGDFASVDNTIYEAPLAKEARNAPTRSTPEPDHSSAPLLPTYLQQESGNEIAQNTTPKENLNNDTPNEKLLPLNSSFIHKIMSFLTRKKSRNTNAAHSATSAFPEVMSEDLPVDEDGNVIITSADDWEKFYRLYRPVKEMEAKVAGVTFDNDDGSSRQSILSLCSPGDMIDLEYFTYHGKPAYAVYTEHGQIGNLPAEIATAIKVIYDDYVTTGKISRITGGYNGLFYGCNLTLTVYKKK